MSDKRVEGFVKMSTDFVLESKRMADSILAHVHRGPGDTVDAAMHRAERLYGVPAAWLHRLRYREIKDLPTSAFFAIANAYRALRDVPSGVYLQLKDAYDTSLARNSKLVGLADFISGTAAKEGEE